MPAERAYVPDMSLMTAEALLRTSVPNKRTELVRGHLVVREPAGWRHGEVTMNLAARLARHVDLTGAGKIVAAETGFTLFRGPDTVRAPDIAFVSRERLPDSRTPGFPELAPDLVVEVVSPFDTAAASFCANVSYTASCTSSRFAHTQVCPVLRYLDMIAPSTAALVAPMREGRNRERARRAADVIGVLALMRIVGFLARRDLPRPGRLHRVR